MSEPTIVTVLRADHRSGLHGDPHPRHQYCEECGAQPEQAPGWQVIDPDGNVVDSGPLTKAEAVAALTQSEGE